MTANAWQAPPPARAGKPVKAAQTAQTYTTAGLIVPAVASSGQKLPGVQQVAYVVPQNPASLVQFPSAPVGPAQEEHTGMGAGPTCTDWFTMLPLQKTLFQFAAGPELRASLRCWRWRA